MTPVDRPAWWDLERVGALPSPEPVAALRARRSPEVLVVGLGAAGLTAVAALAARGVDVVGLDARGVAAGASGANGGFLLAGLALFHDAAVARLGRSAAAGWYRRTLDELDRAADEEPTFRRVGSLRIAADDDELVRIGRHLAALRADGLPGEPYDGPEGRGLLVPSDGGFDPAARCARLARRAVADGAMLVAPADVHSVEPGRVLLRDAEELTAGAVLVCVDGGVEQLLAGAVAQLLGMAAPGVRTARLQMLATAPDAGVALPRPVYHRDGMDYAQQVDGRVLVGGGRDVGGAAEWTHDRGTTAAVQAHLDAWAARLGVTAPVTHRWAATSAFTADRLPLSVAVAPGLHVVGGYSGHGNLLGPLLARDAAHRLLDAPAG